MGAVDEFVGARAIHNLSPACATSINSEFLKSCECNCVDTDNPAVIAVGSMLKCAGVPRNYGRTNLVAKKPEPES
eukprot:788151-Amphidinium_carterae.1